MLGRRSGVMFVFVVAALLVSASTSTWAQQQVATFVVDAPIYLEPGYVTPIATVPQDTTATILGAQGPWLRVSVRTADGTTQIGYVKAECVRALERGAAMAVPAPGAPPSTTTSAPERATAAGASTSPQPPVSAASVSVADGAHLKEIKIRGYVTDFRTPTDFDIEDYRITRDQEFALDFENASPDVQFQLNDIRVGVELEIKGLLNQQTGELKAKAIKVDLEQFKPIKETAFVSVAPEGIQLLDGSWAGELRADGQVIRVTNATKVVFKPTDREKKLAKNAGKSAAGQEEAQATEPLKSLDQVKVGMAMTYEGKRDRSTGKIIADRIEFSNNELEDGEAKLWKSLKVSVKEAQGLNPGELKIDQIGKFKLLPDAEVQSYIASIGQRLIPAYQRVMSPDDPQKIPFQFHVVINDEANAFCTPNGIVVINSGLLTMLDNEAELAAVLGHEISHATQEHTWRARNHRKKTRIAIALAGAVAAGYGMRSLADLASMINGAIVNGYARDEENQADRIGLEYMAAAGYDPRQAPEVWKLMVKKNGGVSSTNVFWSNHDNEPTRRSYLMNELKNNYRNVDFSVLRINADEYSRIKTLVVDATKKKTKLKVTN